jgi:hypothetical protein
MMGYGMALNVRKKIPSTSKLFIYDISPAILKKFQEEAGGEVAIVSSSKEVVDHAVFSRVATKLTFRIPLSLCYLKALMLKQLS